MNDRLISYANLQSFIPGLCDVESTSTKGVRVCQILEDVSRAIETEILRSPMRSLLMSTSDGVSGAAEFYGTEQYGRHKRTIINLRRFPVVSITSINDNGTILLANQYYVDPNAAIIYRTVGKFFCAPGAVQIVYTAGFSSSGTGDTYQINVPADLQSATGEQVNYQWSQMEPGGVPFGITTVSRPDGSLVSKAVVFTDRVQAVIDRYRRSPR